MTQTLPTVNGRPTTDIVEGVKRFAQLFRNVTDLAELVQNVESMDQAVRDADCRLTAKRAEEAQMDATLTAKQALISDAESAAADARRQANEAIESAQKKAQWIISEARKDADHTLASLDAAIRAKRNELDSANAAFEAKVVEHGHLTQKIAHAKSVMAKFMNA